MRDGHETVSSGKKLFAPAILIGPGVGNSLDRIPKIGWSDPRA
jgi:hypothetical protein